MTATLSGPAAPAAEIGRDRRRKEDAHLLTGRTTWTDNIVLPGMVHLAMLRSPMAHATIASISVDAARSAPGVLGVWAGSGFPEQGGLPCAWPITPDMKAPFHPPVAVSEVKHAGEIVAVVAARSKADAVDAVELIEVEYTALPVVTDMMAALADGSPLVHSDLGTNQNAVWIYDSEDAGFGGNARQVIAAAEADPDQIVLHRTFRQQRLIPAFMEPRSTVVDPNGQQITVWSSTQVPHLLRFLIAATQGIPEHQLRVIAPDVGGGFGGKLQTTPEEVVTLMVARKLGKPAKYTETRSESLLSGHHGRDQIQRLTLSARRDGTVTALDVDLLADMGAYLGMVTPGVPILGAFMFNSIYKFEAYRFSCTNVFTNKAWTDAYRGAGRPEATFAIERLMDDLAAELAMDPLELRRKNWIGHEEFPFTTVGSMTYDSGNYEAATDRATELFGYAELRAEQERRRAAGDPVQLGIGISTYTEMCGLAPSRVLSALRYGAGGWEAASIRMLPTGGVEVVTGTSAHGQGHETAIAQIVADRLGVDFDKITVLHGDTGTAPKGLDTYGSRSLVVGGTAVVNAAEKVLAKAKVLAAHLMEASEDDIEFGGGKFRVRGTDTAMDMGDVASAAWTSHNLPDGVEPHLDSGASVDPQTFSFPHGTHLCAAEVDTQTGRVRIRSYICVDDVGVVINPLLVEGQVHGGLAQGIAQALYEEALYTEDGQLASGTLVDYLVPTAPDLPHFTTDRTSTPSTTNPLGVKGVGEAGTIASTPAVVNAVLDAVRHLGVSDITMPCTPERVWRAVRDASSAAAPAAASGAADGGESSVPAEGAPAAATGGPAGDPGALSTGVPTTAATDSNSTDSTAGGAA